MKIDWRKRKLIEICDLVRGSEPGSTAYIKESTDTIPFLRIGDLSGKVNKQKFISKKLKNITIVNPSEILITFDGTPGIVTKGWNGAISSGIRIVRNIKRDEIQKDFLFYYLQTPTVQETIRFYSIGITILHASRSIPHIKIKIPPLSIQHKIVERLDTIRKAQQLNEKQISLANELFQSLLQKELDPKGKYWKMARLGSILSVLTDYHANGSYKILREHVELKSEPDYAYMVRTSDLEKNNYMDNVKYISKDAYNFLKKTKLYGGEILINKIGSAGKIYLMPHLNKPVSLGMNLFLLRIKKEVSNNLFIYYFLNTKIGTSQLLSRVTGAVTKTITKDSIRSIRTSLPPLKTQCQIVKKLSAVQEYKKKLLKQKELFQELFETTLNKAMKGELV